MGYGLRRGPRRDPDNRLLWRRRPAAAGGRDLPRRGAVGERHAEPGAVRARVQAAHPARPCWPATRRTRTPRTLRDTESTRRHRLHVPQAGRPAPADAGVRRPDAAVSCGRRNVTTVAQRRHAQRYVPARPRGRSRAAAPGRGRRDARGLGDARLRAGHLAAPGDAERAASCGSSSALAPPFGTEVSPAPRRARLQASPSSPRCSSA